MKSSIVKWGFIFAAAGIVVAAIVILFVSAWFPSPQEAGYRFIGGWGRPGSGPGEFREPIGIAIAENKVFVSDAGNHRIQVFDLRGNFLYLIGSTGELERPMHIDVRDGVLYVADFGRDEIELFSLRGKSLRSIGRSGSGPGEFDGPGGVVVDESGRLYVADFYNQRVQLFGPEGRFIRQIGTTREKGIRAGRFNYPTDVALLPGGVLAVADAYNDRVQLFGVDGTFLRKWGGPFAMNLSGSAKGWFKTATGVAAGPAETLFVADFYNNRIQKFSSKGGFLVTIGRGEGGPDRLSLPTDMALDNQGNLYVVDFGNQRVRRFAPR